MTQCDGCAFKDGAAANVEPYNRLRSEICAIGGLPFFCHANIDWRKDLTGKDPEQLGAELRKTGICAGWRERVLELKSGGHFDDPEIRIVRRLVAAYALQKIDEWADAPAGEEKQFLHGELSRAIGMLVETERDHFQEVA